jgi:hypothetical protein
VNNMNTKIYIPVILVSLLSGCAATDDLAHNDPIRARVLAELEQAKAEGLVPITEAQYMYPWPGASSQASAARGEARAHAASTGSGGAPAKASSASPFKSDS